MKRKTFLFLFLFFFSFLQNSLALDDKERKFGFYADRLKLSKETETILFNEALNKRITEIGNRVAKASDMPDIQYTFRVINNPIINAFAVANGFVYINTGLLDILESEDELGALIAHEIVHINKSHQINYYVGVHRRAVAGKIVSGILGAVISGGLVVGAAMLTANTATPTGPSPFFEPLADVGMKIGTAVGDEVGYAMAESMILGYGREQELEADALAVRYVTSHNNLTQKSHNQLNVSK